MKNEKYLHLQEEVYSGTCQNGLSYFIIPKKGFQKSVVCFGTKFGALVEEFIPIGKTNKTKLPQGIAHFLEHKLFEMSDGTDATEVFASLGLDANAYTDYNQTVYLFSGTDNIELGLRFLLDYVQESYFTDENIAKEQGIIEQELKMYLDNPKDRLHYGLMENLFHIYPIRNDIGGTLDSIKEINKDNLTDCYRSFYHPSNMIIVYVGPIDPSNVEEWIVSNQESKHFSSVNPITTFLPIEPDEINRVDSSIVMDVAKPIAALGIKTKPILQKSAVVLEEIAWKILLETYLGPASVFYQKSLDTGLVTEGIQYSVYFDKHIGFIKIGANTKQPTQWIQTVKQEIEQLKTRRLTIPMFQRYKKALLGSFIKGLNSLEYIATLFLELQIRSMDLFALIQDIEKLELSDIKKIQKELNAEHISTCTIYPSNK